MPRCLMAFLWLAAFASPVCAAYTYSYQLLDVPGADETWAMGMNDADQVVGSFSDALGQHGFFFDGLGTFTTLDVPGADRTWGQAVNALGWIVGSYRDSKEYGFLYDGDTYTDCSTRMPPTPTPGGTASTTPATWWGTTTPGRTAATRTS